MNQLRKLLFPFSILYGFITDIRNKLYFANILKRTRFEKPVIVVGNLSVGGTGKTPFVEYLLRLLNPTYRTATLSRGYKRKSKGFIIAQENTTMEEIGDEPYQYHHKFQSTVVAVDAKRVNGINQLLKREPKLDVIILDDAYQHLAVDADLNILLTTYSELYCDDYVLPAGNLRETRKGAQRANIIIITKCPRNIPLKEQNSIKIRLKLKSHQEIFFTYINYSNHVISSSNSVLLSEIDFNTITLVAGIAKPQSFFNYLKKERTKCLSFPDHHNFTKSDISSILKEANGNKIITTEKDFVRLKNQLPMNQLYYLPIQTSFITNRERMDQIILDYVGKSSRNSKIHSK